MPLPSNTDSLIEELKHVHLQSYVWLNALEATLPSLNILFYGWQVRGDCEGVSMWFNENQLPSSIASSSETDLKKNEKETELNVCNIFSIFSQLKSFCMVKKILITFIIQAFWMPPLTT